MPTSSAGWLSATSGVGDGVTSGAVGSAEGLAVGDGVGSAEGVSRPAPRVHDGACEVRSAGVGSKRTQPEPGKYSSGHACRSRPLKLHSVLRPSKVGDGEPLRNPTATRAGMPSARAIAAIEAENCSQ